jgi:cell division protein FtsW (lipid II flippase)
VSFSATLQTWHDVYVTAGAGAATLAGLLFVGLSLHIRTVVSHPDVRSLARVTLSDFFVVLVLSLFLLAPSDGPQTLGYEVGGIGLIGLLLMLRPALAGIHNRRTRSLWLRVLLFRFGLSALAHLALIVAGAAFVVSADFADVFRLLLIVVVVLLMVAVRNTWDLLVTVAEKKPG